MGDGHRTFTLTMTEAQRDLFIAATEVAVEKWDVLHHPLRTRIATLKRAMEQFDAAWETGIKR